MSPELDGFAVRKDGRPVTCDGCDAPILAGFDVATQVWPIDPGVGRHAYGTAALVYIVCPPVDGRFECLSTARLRDELFLRTRCTLAGCDGRCGTDWRPRE